MKIKYVFANETVEIDVEEQWANIVQDLDRQDYNIDHKETRRHCSLDAYNIDAALLPSAEDIVEDTIQKIENEKLYSAIARLSPCQQKAVKMVYLDGRSFADTARELGCEISTVMRNTEHGLKKIKKFL